MSRMRRAVAVCALAAAVSACRHGESVTGPDDFPSAGPTHGGGRVESGNDAAADYRPVVASNGTGGTEVTISATDSTVTARNGGWAGSGH
jgi:hypothetical protein